MFWLRWTFPGVFVSWTFGARLKVPGVPRNESPSVTCLDAWIPSFDDERGCFSAENRGVHPGFASCKVFAEGKEGVKSCMW